MGDDLAFRAQMAEATRREIPLVLICGGREFKSETVAIKDMKARKQETVEQKTMVNYVKSLLDQM